MPGLLQHRTNLEQASSQQHINEPVPQIAAEGVLLWLPSHLPPSLQRSICIAGLPEIEERLRTAQCHGALETLRKALRLKTHMVSFRNKNSRGQRKGLRSRVLID